ncbi:MULTISPECIES: hypothetical protein [Undibacterium]|uniref:Lipoprotein n=2 Tax=Undibacterium TaxID=401469 RepID=A0A850QP55_9BURK|nr:MULTISPECIES: hypothetical protein [Undibacterium]MBC3870183.1 hypothetical protein [Undibacterium oligocarboniphilum]MBC3886079.1 hypothetical protein [Undibacterium griseum]NVO78174.1 hypothetical protein [Undibacterium oligocarboniphilum]
MLKKSLLPGLLFITTLAGVSVCNAGLAMTSASLPQTQQDRSTVDTAVETVSASANAQIQTQLDRSGVDRASVHLQLLQQSNSHFSEIVSPKKPGVYDKKAQIKAPSNS